MYSPKLRKTCNFSTAIGRIATSSSSTSPQVRFLHLVYIEGFPGLAVEAPPHEEADTLERRIKDAHPHLDVFFPHTLDKWCSGLQIVAFNRDTTWRIARSMQDHTKWHK